MIASLLMRMRLFLRQVPFGLESEKMAAGCHLPSNALDGRAMLDFEMRDSFICLPAIQLTATQYVPSYSRKQLYRLPYTQQQILDDPAHQRKRLVLPKDRR